MSFVVTSIIKLMCAGGSPPPFPSDYDAAVFSSGVDPRGEPIVYPISKVACSGKGRVCLAPPVRTQARPAQREHLHDTKQAAKIRPDLSVEPHHTVARVAPILESSPQSLDAGGFTSEPLIVFTLGAPEEPWPHFVLDAQVMTLGMWELPSSGSCPIPSTPGLHLGCLC